MDPEVIVAPFKNMVINFGIVIIISLLIVLVVAKIARLIRIPNAILKIVLPLSFLFVFYKLWVTVIL